MSEENKAVIRRIFEEMDKRNEDAVRELVASDLAYHLPGVPEPLNRDAFIEIPRGFYAAFPDLQHVIEFQVAEGDKVATHSTLRATHRGEFQGIAPTGKQVAFTATQIDRVVDGKLVERWVEVAQLALLQQLGAIPNLG